MKKILITAVIGFALAFIGVRVGFCLQKLFGFQPQFIEYTDETTVNYYGFVHENGEWYIMKSTGANITYTRGLSLSTAAWVQRTTQTFVNYEDLW